MPQEFKSYFQSCLIILDKLGIIFVELSKDSLANRLTSHNIKRAHDSIYMLSRTIRSLECIIYKYPSIKRIQKVNFLRAHLNIVIKDYEGITGKKYAGDDF